MRFCVRFIRPYDSIAVSVAGIVAHLYDRAKIDSVTVGEFSNHIQRGQALLKITNAPIQSTQFFLAVNVFGVLRTITFGGGFGQSLYNIAASKPVFVLLFLLGVEARRSVVR